MENEMYDKINNWLSGEMPEKEKKAFEREMENNPALAREVVLAKEALAAVNEKDIIAFREQMDGIMSEEMPGAEHTKNNWKRFFIITALFALGILAYLFLKKEKPPTPVKTLTPIALYETHFPPPENLILDENTRTGQVTAPAMDSLKKKAASLIRVLNKQFQERKYSEAFSTLDSIKNIDPAHHFIKNKGWHFSKGMLYLVTDQPAPAISSFKLANKNVDWDDVQWYMAAAYVKMKNYDEAKNILKILSDGNNQRLKNKAR